MTTGFGMAPDRNGNGTTPDDLQAVIAAQYPEPGIISGCEVKGSAAMSYQLSAGAVCIHLAPGRAVLVPVPAQQITTPPAPTNGSRTEYIYVQQLTEPVNGSVASKVAIGATVPANAVMLSKREIRANIKATSATQEAGNIVFSRPVGGSLGVLHHHETTRDTPHKLGEFRRGAGTFFVPTDRTVDIRLTSTVTTATSETNVTPVVANGSLFYDVYIDDRLVLRRERAFTNIWESKDFSTIQTLQKGQHRIHYVVRHTTYGHQYWVVRGENGGFPFPGDVITVTDIGVAKE